MPSRTQCKRALDLHEDRLSSLSNVVGLGVVDMAENDKNQDNFAVAIYVSRLPGPDEVDSESWPGSLTILGSGDTKIEIPVKLIEQGPVELEDQ